MEFSLIEFLKLAGSLGFFIFAMKVMSEGIQKVGGRYMRLLLSELTKNRATGILAGFLITALVQSSSATTLLTVSLTNTGVLSLIQSASVIMGANIGTTVTAWLISIFGFEINIFYFTLPIIAIAAPLMFSNKSTWRFWSEILIGFALLFISLETLKTVIPDFLNQPEILTYFSGYTDMGFLSVLLFTGIGILLTLIIQSSSAAIAFTLTLAFNGWLPFECAAALILGENIGTTITAELKAMVTNIQAKRAARLHLFFNLFGAVWALLLFSFYLDGINALIGFMGYPSPLQPFDPQSFATDPGIVHELQVAKIFGLSIFHTGFNLITTFLIIWFVPQLIKLAKKLIPSRGEVDEQFQLEYIGSGVMNTMELSVLEAKKEVAKFGKLNQRLMGFIHELMQERDSKKRKKLMLRIKKYEDITDRMEAEIAHFLTRISEGELSQELSQEIRGMLRIISDMERMGDICYQMSKNLERKKQQKIWFTPGQRESLYDMHEAVKNAMDNMLDNLNNDYEQVTISKSVELENNINKLRDDLRTKHLLNMEKGEYNFQSGMIYSDLFSSYEKLGDHIMNVNEGVVGKI